MKRHDTSDAEQPLESARSGGPESLAKLLEVYRPYISLLARLHMDNLVQPKFDESDLVQETCLQAIRDFHQFRGTTEQEFVLWLRRILATKGAKLAREFLGTKQRNVRLERALQLEIDQSSEKLATFLTDSASSPSQQAARREYSVILAEAIAQLEGAHREVIILHGLEGHSVAEVAKTMGRTEGSVWKLWARALIALRRILGESS